MLGLPAQFVVARLLEDVVELVYMSYPEFVVWPDAFVAVQPCCPDWSQNCENVDWSQEESNGSL